MMKEYRSIEILIQIFEQDVVTSSGFAIEEDNANEVLDGWFDGGNAE
jgi:hypothetical protein